MINRGRGLFPSECALWRRLRLLDLRFPDSSAEQAFVESNIATLQKTTFLCCVLLLGGTLFHAIPVWIREAQRSDNPLSMDAVDKRFEHILVTAGLVLGIFVCGGLILCHWRWRYFRCVDWEKLITGFMCYGVALMFYGGTVEQYDIWEGEANGQAIEMTALLIVDAIVTAACLFMPIRICILWALPVFAFMSYIVASTARGLQFHGTTTTPMFVLLCLVIFSLGGAFRHEQHVRKDFLSAKAVECKDSEIQEIAAVSQGMQSVAETLCDFVVMLAKDLRIMDDSSLKFFLNSFSDASESMRFIDLLDPSDAERFDKVLNLAVESKMPQCLQVTLQLGGGSSVEVKLLVVNVHHAQMQFLVGIQVERAELSQPAGTLLPSVESKRFHRELPQSAESETSLFLSGTTLTGAGTSIRNNSVVKLIMDATTQTVDTSNEIRSRSYGVQTDMTFKSEAFKPSPRPPIMPIQEDRPPPALHMKFLRRSNSAGSFRRRRAKSTAAKATITPGVGRPVLKKFAATELKSVRYACSLLLSRINAQGVACCPWHLGIEYIKQALSSDSTCALHFKPFTGWQCHVCGMMNEADDGDCMICYQEKGPPQEESIIIVL